MYTTCSFNALQNVCTVVHVEMHSECESNGRRALLTAGSAGKLLTYEKCCKENCGLPVGIHCNLAILFFKNVK